MEKIMAEQKKRASLKKSYVGLESKGWLLVESLGYVKKTEYYMCKCLSCGALKRHSVSNLRTGRVSICACRKKPKYSRNEFKLYKGPRNNLTNNNPIETDPTLMPYAEAAEPYVTPHRPEPTYDTARVDSNTYIAGGYDTNVEPPSKLARWEEEAVQSTAPAWVDPEDSYSGHRAPYDIFAGCDD